MLLQVVWKPDWKKPVNGPKCPVFKWSAKSCDFTVWKPDTHTVRYSDESGIQVFGIQMVIVHIIVILKLKSITLKIRKAISGKQIFTC